MVRSSVDRGKRGRVLQCGLDEHGQGTVQVTTGQRKVQNIYRSEDSPRNYIQRAVQASTGQRRVQISTGQRAV